MFSSHQIFPRLITSMALTYREVQDACGRNGSIEAMIKEHGAAGVAAWRDRYGRTALHYAVRLNTDSDVLRALIRAGVDVMVAGNYGYTALHCAKTAEQVRVLMAATANMASLSARNSIGRTPLHIACLHSCLHGRMEAVRAMLAVSSGIPRVVLAKNHRGDTARDIASRLGHAELMPVLDKAMKEAEVWSRRSSTLLIGLAAADVVKAVAVAAGKTWAL